MMGLVFMNGFTGFLTWGQKLGLFLSWLEVESDFFEPFFIFFGCPIKKSYLELQILWGQDLDWLRILFLNNL